MRIGDAPRELDTEFAGDRAVIALGFRAALVLPLGRDAREILWFAHHEPEVYTPEHARALEPIGDLATLASEHAQLQALTRIRRRRREALAALVQALARALDVQTVFAQISEAVQEVLPHDHLSVGLLSPDGAIRFHASSLGTVASLAEYRPTTDFGAESLKWDFYLVYDYAVLPEGVVRVSYWDPHARRAQTREFRPNPALLRSYTERGIRSELRMPFSLQGERVGYLFFTSRRPEAYGEEDVELARRIADHVALAIAHERLAAEAQRARQAEQQATALQGRVDALVEQLESATPHRALGRSAALAGACSRRRPRSRRPTPPCCITGESGHRQGSGRALHPPRLAARGGRSWPSTARRCPSICSNPSCSATSAAPSRAPPAARRAGSSRPRAASLFLDEVGEMSPAVQAKFLRVLQEREFQRLGGTRTLQGRRARRRRDQPRPAGGHGARRLARGPLLSAERRSRSHCRRCASGRRTSCRSPRPFWKRSAAAWAGRRRGSPRTRGTAPRPPWPGNVRELRNAIERAVILCDGGLITGEHLPMALAAPAPEPADVAARPGMSLDAVERDLIRKAMAQANNNKSEAARILGLARGQLYSRLKRYGLTRAKR